MNTELPIVKFIKKGIAYDADNNYKLGEVVEVTDAIAEELLDKKAVVSATKEELEKWQIYLTSEKVRKAHQQEKDQRMKYVKIKIDNYMDNAEYFFNSQPYFYDEVGIFWFWVQNENKYVQKDDIDVMSMLDDILGLEGQTVTSSIKHNYLEAFKRVGRKHKPKDA